MSVPDYARLGVERDLRTIYRALHPDAPTATAADLKAIARSIVEHVAPKGWKPGDPLSFDQRVLLSRELDAVVHAVSDRSRNDWRYLSSSNA